MNLFTWLVTCVGSVVFIEIFASVTSTHSFTHSEVELPCDCALVVLYNGFGFCFLVARFHTIVLHAVVWFVRLSG